MIRAAIFDFDGTLFDATDAIVHSFNTALKQHGRPALPRAAIHALIGRPLFEMFPALEPDATGERAESYIQAYREAFGPVCVKLTRPLPGLRSCVDRLKAAGLAMAIATNRSERGARTILAGFDMEKTFSAIIALEHVTHVKPDPEPVRLACKTLKVDPSEAVMVGDTPDDMKAGRAAGTYAIGVLTGIHDRAALLAAGAHEVLETLEAIPDSLRRR